MRHFHLWFCGSNESVSRGDLWLEHKVQSNLFEGYKPLLSMIMRWMIDLNTGIEHLAFDVNQQHIWATHLNMQTSELSYVTREVYVTFITQVEAKCKNKVSPLSFCLFQFCPLNNLNFRVCFVALNWMWQLGFVGVVYFFVIKLHGRFLVHGFMDNLGVVYPQYWL